MLLAGEPRREGQQEERVQGADSSVGWEVPRRSRQAELEFTAEAKVIPHTIPDEFNSMAVKQYDSVTIKIHSHERSPSVRVWQVSAGKLGVTGAHRPGCWSPNREVGSR